MAMAAASLPNLRWPRGIWPLVAVAALLIYFGVHRQHSDPAKKIAAAVGGTCAATRYGLVNNLTGSKTWIYSCVDSTGRTRCMVRANGVVADVTGEARLVYRNSFSGRPDCL